MQVQGAPGRLEEMFRRQPHVHHWALTAIVDRADRTKSEIASDAQLTPSELGHWTSGRRAGHSEQARQRVADALGVPVEAITCWCDDRRRHLTGEGSR